MWKWIRDSCCKEADFMIHSLLKFELFGRSYTLRRRMSVY